MTKEEEDLVEAELAAAACLRTLCSAINAASATSAFAAIASIPSIHPLRLVIDSFSPNRLETIEGHLATD
jgi:hypothetical protein